MKIALAQLNATIGDFRGNLQRIVAAYRDAAERGAELVLFPELMIPGYPPLDLLYRPEFVRDCERALDELIPRLDGPAAVVGTIRPNPDPRGRPLLNSAAVVDGGSLLGFHDKVLLPTYDVFDEDRYFEPGGEVRCFSIAGETVGVAICEDLWTTDETLAPRYRRDPVSELVSAGAERIVCPSASPYHVRKPAHRESIFAAQAQRHGVPIAVCNMIGGNTELVFDGGSLSIGPGGVFDRAPLFEETVVITEAARDREVSAVRVEPTEEERVDDLASALVLGLRDYFAKCGFRSAVIGLSGGIDSAVTAAVACEALGSEMVRGVAMPSRYSSQGSLDDAAELAEKLGISYSVLPIERLFSTYLETLSPIFGAAAHDVTEENLQARIRGALLMAVSNKYGDIVLSTGNKSELAVGYCTLYGDMCGGLCPLGDVSKSDVYAMAGLPRYRDQIPESTRTKPPSAELRPDQQDSDSLPPYDVLDSILESFVERHMSCSEIPGADPSVVREVVGLVERNEYKRRQAAPTLRVTTKAFGMGRRIPLARRFGESEGPFLKDDA